jgi:hypothetical protein
MALIWSFTGTAIGDWQDEKTVSVSDISLIKEAKL